MSEIDTGFEHVPNVEKSISQYIGLIGEKLALKYLIENGFEVVSFLHCLGILIGNPKKSQERCLKQIEAGKHYATRKDINEESLRRNEEFLKYWKEELKKGKEVRENY